MEKTIKEIRKESFQNMITARGIEFAKIGMTVEVDGKKGKIAGNHGHNLLVRYKKYGKAYNCHPWWRVKYFDKSGNLIKEYGD